MKGLAIIVIGFIGVILAVGPRRWLERDEDKRHPVWLVAVTSHLPVAAQRVIYLVIGLGLVALGAMGMRSSG